MRTTATVIRVLVGIAGVIMLALGVAFWTGNALTLVPIHMLIGLGIALSLWVLALLALLRGVRPWLAVVALLWGVVMPALGLAQGGLLPGSADWVIQSLHLLVGLGGIALAQALGSAVALSQPPGGRDGVVETETLRSRFAHPAASTFGLAVGASSRLLRLIALGGLEHVVGAQVQKGAVRLRQAVSDLHPTYVRSLTRADGGFELELEDGRTCRARRVVVAVGIKEFAHTPAFATCLLPALASHAREHRDFKAFAGMRAAVVGGGQIALESAALLHEAGAAVEVTARRELVWLRPEGCRVVGRVTVTAPADVRCAIPPRRRAYV